MSINGSISVNALFHDTDGTTSLKIVSLKSSDEYTAGKVAVVTGTVGTAVVSVNLAPTTYRDASGALVSFSQVSRIAFAASPAAYVTMGDMATGDSNFGSRLGRACVSEVLHDGTAPADVATTAGTASYTLVLYGT